MVGDREAEVGHAAEGAEGEEEDVDDPARLRLGGERIEEEGVSVARLLHVGEVDVVLVGVGEEAGVVGFGRPDEEAVEIGQKGEEHDDERECACPAELSGRRPAVCLLGFRSAHSRQS